MLFNPYSIVLVPFPFTDSSAVKRRPALVICSKAHQKETHCTTLMMITTAKNSTWPSDYLIQDLKSCGLTTESLIRQKIFTIDSRLIIKKLGELDEKEHKNFTKILTLHLGL